MNGCIENDRASIGFRTALLANAGAAMSALPPEADIRQRIEHVRFVPKADSPPISGGLAVRTSAVAAYPFFLEE